MKNAGFQACSHSLFIKCVNWCKRLQFAKIFVNKTIKVWNDFIFSDISKFNIWDQMGKNWFGERHLDCKFNFTSSKTTA